MLDSHHVLLLGMLHRDEGKADQARLRAFDADEWNAFCEAAIHYRLACQAHAFLSAHPELHAPPGVIERLHAVVHQQLHFNFAQYMRLREVLLACEAAALPIIIFKGLWLVEYVYADPKSRLSGDIDLLIRPEDMPRFTRLAREMGCAVPEGVDNLRSLAPAGKEYPLASRNNETTLDIHWALTSHHRRSIDEGSIWSRAEKTSLGGVGALTFSLEDHLLFLCYHAAVLHRFMYVGPRALLDIALFIQQPPRPIDWMDVVTRARHFQWERAVWLTFDLVREHLGVSPPESVLADLQPVDPPGAALREKIIETVFLDQTHHDRIAPNAMRLIDALWSEKLRILAQRLFPPKEDVATQFKTPVDSAGFHLLYVKRLWVMAGTHLPRLLQTVGNNPVRQQEKDRMVAIEDWLKD